MTKTQRQRVQYVPHTSNDPDTADIPAVNYTRRLQQMEAQLNNLQKLMAAERPVLLPTKLSHDREQWYQDMVKEIGTLSNLEKTQKVAIERWGDETEDRYLVDVMVPKGTSKPDLHPMIIPARNKYEAKGRYEELFGINSLEQTIKIVCERQAA